MTDSFDYMKKISGDVDEYILKFLLRFKKDKIIYEIVSHLPKIMRKRPKITATFGMLIYEALGGRNYSLVIPVFAAMELSHTATYVLDDIIDNQPFRHGKSATWKKYGLNYGIVAGSLQIFIAKKMVFDSNLDDRQKLKISQMMDEMWITLWIGEGKNEEMKEGTTLDKYIQRCYKIAGVMLSCTAKITPVVLEESLGYIKTIGDIGKFYGIAAMIRNDLMNLVPQELVRGGKSKALLRIGYEDVKRGLWTYPIIAAMEKLNGQKKVYIKSLLGKEKATGNELMKFTKILIKCEALDSTSNLITKYKNKAMNLVSCKIPPTEKQSLLLNFIENLENSRLYVERLKHFHFH